MHFESGGKDVRVKRPPSWIRWWLRGSSTTIKLFDFYVVFQVVTLADFPQNAYKIRLMSKQIQHSQGCKVNLSHTSLWKESKVPSLRKKFCSDLRGTLWVCQLHCSFTPYRATGSLGFRNIHRGGKKKKIPLSLIRSVLTPLWSLAASQSLQLEGGGEGLLLWFLRYPGRAVLGEAPQDQRRVGLSKHLMSC